MDLNKLTLAILDGYQINEEEARHLYTLPLSQLLTSAKTIRDHFCGNDFDLCTIINAKSGQCSENCAFCAQSSHHQNSDCYPLLSCQALLEQAAIAERQGIMRYSLVTSGRKLNKEEISLVCQSIKLLKDKTNLSICGSFGLLDKDDYLALYQAGLRRIHNNLETGPSFFPNICTTHQFSDKVKSLQAAKEAGMDICSGGIIGLGESVDNRLELAFHLRTLNVQSVPVNVLNPIAGTPLGNNPTLSHDEILQTIAVFRHILPTAFIRLAGGRSLFPDKGRLAFTYVANATITGDMLTTAGINTQGDMQTINELGFKIVKPLY